MIKIGTKKDLTKISHLPMNIQNAICEDVEILDCSYGENRNIDVDMGGFVVVCDKDEKLDIVHFNKNFDTPEYIQEICPYKKMLFISGTERNIIIEALQKDGYKIVPISQLILTKDYTIDHTGMQIPNKQESTNADKKPAEQKTEKNDQPTSASADIIVTPKKMERGKLT